MRVCKEKSCKSCHGEGNCCNKLISLQDSCLLRKGDVCKEKSCHGEGNLCNRLYNFLGRFLKDVMDFMFVSMGPLK